MYNAVYCGNSNRVLGELSGVNLICTSPPYFKKRDTIGIGASGEVDEYLDALIEIAHKCFEALTPDGSFVVNLGDKYINGWMLVPHQFALRVIKETGFFLVNEITWVKKNPTPRFDKRKLVPSFEPIYHFAKSKDYKYRLERFSSKDDGKPITARKGESYRKIIDESSLSRGQKDNALAALGNAVERVRNGETTDFRMKVLGTHALPYGGYEGGRMRQLKRDGFVVIEMTGNKMVTDTLVTSVGTVRGIKHHSVFPIEIPNFFIELLTDEGDLVVDPFCGSGTTLLAAKDKNRAFIGVDINRDFAEIAANRLDLTPIDK